MTDKRITRRELHALVWSKPMREAAAEIGISDVGLKKVCVRHDIPTPPQGHWLRAAHGRGVPTVPLASGRPEQVIVINVAAPEPQMAPLPQTEQSRYEALIERERQSGTQIRITSEPASWHRMTKQVRQVLKGRKPDDYGCLQCYEKELPFIRVTPERMERALVLLDAMVRAFEQRGYSWRPGSGSSWDASASIVIEEVAFKIGIYEAVTRHPHVLTPEEQRKEKRGEWFYPRKYDFLSTDQLSIRLDDYEIYLRDAQHRRLEDRLNELLIVLTTKAFETREQWRLAAIRAEEEAARQARREEIEKLKAARTAAAERLRTQAANWRKAQELRAFIAMVEKLPAFAAHPDRDRWRSWAREQADALDPSTDPKRILSVDFDAFARLEELLGT